MLLFKFKFLILILHVFVYYSICMETKKCINCKNYIHSGQYGLCKIFANKVYIGKNKENILFNFAEHCRKDENLCGKDGLLYEDNMNIVKTNQHKAKEKAKEKFFYYTALKIIKDNW